MVDIKVKFKPHLQQQATLNHTRWNARIADCPEKNRIKFAQFVEGFIREDLAIVEIPSPTEIEIFGLDCNSSGSHNLQCLRSDLWANAISPYNCNAIRHTRMLGRQDSLAHKKSRFSPPVTYDI